MLLAMIDVQNLSKTYRIHKKKPGLKGSITSLFFSNWIENKALDQVNLKVKEGEILGLVGANGAGKTTLVKILAGIIHPSHGKVEVLGHEGSWLGVVVHRAETAAEVALSESLDFDSQVAVLLISLAL